MNEGLILETLPEIIKTTSSGISIIKSGKWIIDYFARHEPAHVKERLGRNWELMLEYIHEKHQSTDPGDAWRNDWFAENQVSNRRHRISIIRETIKEIINDSEERKSEYIAKFWVNICLTSNSDIDEATAFSYLETIESLSWRQLCIIRLIILCKNKEVDMMSIEEEEKEKWIEQMPQDEQTRFYSISRDFENLANNKCFEAVAPLRAAETQPPLLLLRPNSAHATDYTRRLHSLMNLNEIPDGEIQKTFSIWKVRWRKSEEDLGTEKSHASL